MNRGIFLLLGTNLGDRFKNLETAKRLITVQAGNVEQRSSIYKTAPWGQADQPEFYNQVIKISTIHEPEQLLSRLLDVEKQIGRTRHEKWGSRIIDIDILFFDQVIVKADGLTIPHPAIQARKFTLVPMAEIAADYVHPVLKKDIRTLLEECHDTLAVELIPQSKG